MTNEELHDAIYDGIYGGMRRGFVSEGVESPTGDDANVVDALAMIARALKFLGNADAATPMGALEAHGKAVLEASENILSGLGDIAEAIREARE